MILWDKNGVIRRYDTPEEIIADFYGLRLQFYDKRRCNLIKVCFCPFYTHLDLTLDLIPESSMDTGCRGRVAATQQQNAIYS